MWGAIQCVVIRRQIKINRLGDIDSAAVTPYVGKQQSRFPAGIDGELHPRQIKNGYSRDLELSAPRLTFSLLGINCQRLCAEYPGWIIRCAVGHGALVDRNGAVSVPSQGQGVARQLAIMKHVLGMAHISLLRHAVVANLQPVITTPGSRRVTLLMPQRFRSAGLFPPHLP